MNPNSAQLCRLCLETSAGLVNVFEKFEDSTIASVLAEHFWFQIHKSDGTSEWVCETCWCQTKTFHHFYKKLELLHQNYVNSIVLVKVDDIKRERSVSPIEEALAVGSNIIKSEDEILGADDTHPIAKEDSSDDSNAEILSASDDEDQVSNEKLKAEDVIGKSIKFQIAKHSPSEIDRQNAEIRRIFRMKCEICSDVEFDTIKNMRKHYRQVHETEGYLICCGAKFVSRRVMLDHAQYHANPDAHRCDQCGKSFRNGKTLRNHVKSHERVQECSLCSKTYSSAAVLKGHVRDKHTDTSVKFHCDICGKTYPTKGSVYSHIKNCHEPTPVHVCDGCGRSFKSKTDLKYHIEMLHSTAPPPRAQCDICGVWSKNKRCLRLHLRRHQEWQNAQDTVLNCPICKKKVQSKRLLTNHISHSHGARNHKCTFCDKAFRRLKSLKEHIALHTGEDLYSCLYCDKTFKSNANMYSHRKKAHLAEWTRDKVEKNRYNQVDATETETTSKNADK